MCKRTDCLLPCELGLSVDRQLLAESRLPGTLVIKRRALCANPGRVNVGPLCLPLGSQIKQCIEARVTVEQVPHPDNSVFRRIVSVLTAANKAPTPAVPRHKEDRLHVVENVDADIGFLTALHFLSAGTEGVVPLGSVFPCFLPPASNDRLWPFAVSNAVFY